MPKITLYSNQIQKQLDDVFKDTELAESAKNHGAGYVHFVKKELHRKGYDPEIKESGEGSEGEYDDAELTQDEKLKLASDFVALPSFAEWYEQPDYAS